MVNSKITKISAIPMPVFCNGEVVKEFKDFSGISFSSEENNPNPEPKLSLGGSVSFPGNADIPFIHGDDSQEFINTNKQFGLGFHKYVQRRKHRKRRINKKWAKRYGYKKITINIDCENMTIEPEIDSDGNFYAFAAVIKPDSAGNLISCIKQDEIFYGNPEKDTV